jgi:hypothetical protein
VIPAAFAPEIAAAADSAANARMRASFLKDTASRQNAVVKKNRQMLRIMDLARPINRDLALAFAARRPEGVSHPGL